MSTPAPFRLDGRLAIVTGASSGLGRRFAQVLAGAGATVVVAARRASELESLAGEIGGNAVVADLTGEDGRRSVVRAALELAPSIDILVNNAGQVTVVRAEEESMESFSSVIALNLSAQFGMCQAVGREMLKAGRGSVVNVASILGLVGTGQMPQASYSASKGGLINLTRELAAQWARQGVRVNALAPGYFPSEMTADLLASSNGQKWLRGKIPMGRVGEPEELDGALLFLASDASSYMTGQVLTVDGGYTAV